eukprot:1112288-Pelagomonas_calceolata.AAC.2
MLKRSWGNMSEQEGPVVIWQREEQQDAVKKIRRKLGHEHAGVAQCIVDEFKRKCEPRCPRC